MRTGRMTKRDTQIIQHKGFVAVVDKEYGDIIRAYQLPDAEVAKSNADLSKSAKSAKSAKESAQESSAIAKAWKDNIALFGGIDDMPHDFMTKALISAEYLNWDEPTLQRVDLLKRAYNITKQLEEADESGWMPWNWDGQDRKFVSANVGMAAISMSLEGQDIDEIKKQVMMPTLAAMKATGTPTTPDNVAQYTTYVALGAQSGMTAQETIQVISSALQKGASHASILKTLRIHANRSE
jgi:hypothetical protein